MKDERELEKIIEGKKVLYIATKNSDYIRVQQEIKLIKKLSNDYKIIVCSDKSYLKRLIKCFLKSLFVSTKNYEVIIIGFMAQMIVPWIWWRWKKQLIITDFFISIYDTLVDDRKKLKDNSVLAKIVKKIDKSTIKKSDYIIVDTKAHGNYFISELGASPDKCYTLYLQANKEIYYPREIERPEIYKGKFLVLYFGSILPLQGVEYVLEAANILKDQKKIHFILIGPIDKQYKRINSDTITYIRWLPQNELADYIAFSDLCLGGHFSNDIGKAKRTIPGKVYIYKAMDKDVILGDSYANRELFKESQQNHFVPMGDSMELAKSIHRVYIKYYGGEKDENKFYNSSL